MWGWGGVAPRSGWKIIARHVGDTGGAKPPVLKCGDFVSQLLHPGVIFDFVQNLGVGEGLQRGESRKGEGGASEPSLLSFLPSGSCG